MDYLKLSTFFLYFIPQVVYGFELVNNKNVSSRTCIIGAGYSGIATAKHLKDYNMDFTVFEASKYLGGVWHFDPRVGVDEVGIPIFNKMYKNLRLLQRLGNENFIKLYHNIFRRLVTSVKRFKNQWQLSYYRGDTKETVTEVCDHIVIASGFVNNPVWPEIPGEDTFQGTISHSYTYRGDVEVYRNRRVLILGAGASGLDIASHISKVASKLFHSHHKTINMPVHEKSYVKKPDIKSITHNGVIFNDGSFEEVDDIIYCTGFLNTHPFLDSSSNLIRNGKFILPLYRKIVNIKHPNMFFIGAAKKTYHKALDAQGNYAASLIAGKFQLPSENEMMKSWINDVNNIQNINNINSITETVVSYVEILSKEAGIPPLPPVYASMVHFNAIIRKNDYIHYKDYDWRIIDDYNFDRVYVGPNASTCSIQ